jgi:hypothetical protein
MVFHPAEAKRPDYFEVSLPDAKLRVYTVDGRPGGDLSQFEITSMLDTYRGDVSWGDGEVTIDVTLRKERAHVKWQEREDFSEVTVDYVDNGLVRLEMWEDGTYYVLDNTIDDCSAAVANSLYQANQFAANQLSTILSSLDPSSQSTPDLAVIQTFFLALEPVSVAPGSVGCSLDVQDPAWGVCGLYPDWANCIQCCIEDGDRDDLWAALLGRLASEIPIIGKDLGTAVSIAISSDNCESFTCTGLPGDPDPTPCGDLQGVCTDNCFSHGGYVLPSGDCDPGLVCCQW